MLNFSLMKNPLNWLIVGLMLAFAYMAWQHIGPLAIRGRK